MNLKNCAVGIVLSASCILPLYAQQKSAQPNARIFLNNDYHIDGYIDSDEMTGWKEKEFLTVKSDKGKFTVRTKEIKRIDKPDNIKLGNKIDRIRLKNDSTLEGVEYYEDDKTIRLKVNDGEIVINKSDIYGTEAIEIKKKPKPGKKAVEGIELIPHTEKTDEKSPWPDDSWPLDKKILKLIELLESKDDAIIYGGMEGNVYGKMKNKGAIQFLTEIGAPAVPFLVDKMDGSKPQLLSRIVNILNNIKAPDTIDYMKNRLSDNSPLVRSQAVTVLGAVGNPDASPHIRPLLKDKDANVRLAVIDAISNLKDTDSLTGLVSLVTDQDEAVKGKVLTTLPFLYGLCKDEGEKRDVIDALKDLADTKGEEVRRNVATLFGKLKGNGVNEKLTEFLRDDSNNVRANAVVALGTIGSPELIQPLIERLKTEDDKFVKLQILKVLKSAQSLDAIPTIIDVMRRASDKDTQEACWLTLKALTNMRIDNDPDAWAKWLDERRNGRKAQQQE